MGLLVKFLARQEGAPEPGPSWPERIPSFVLTRGSDTLIEMGAGSVSSSTVCSRIQSEFPSRGSS